MEATLTLLEFTQKVGSAINMRPDLRGAWIVAELSDVALRGGHFYADLIQKNDAGQTVARMRANLWASAYAQLRGKFFKARRDDLRNGIKVRIQGAATHHHLYGLSFNITDIDPSYVDEGDLLRRRMEILRQMKEEGIYDDNRMQPLPADTQRIAVVSAEGAAGLGDFLNQLENNRERFRFTTRLFPSPMQGERAPAGIMAALRAIAAEQDRWDCVVIIRGGGATADMNCFDDMVLARNVCCFPLPVIVGIGHERDNCVLDYLAHTRCKTPTAVAEFLVGHQRQAWQRVSDMAGEIIRFTTLHLEGEKRHLSQLETAVPAAASQHIEREKVRLKSFATSFPLAVNGIASREHTRLEGWRRQLAPVASTAISRASDRLESLRQLLGVLSPANTLKRGYSITRMGGKAVRDASRIPEGTVLETQLASGTVVSRVEP